MELKQITAKELKAKSGIGMLFLFILGLLASIGILVAGAIMLDSGIAVMQPVGGICFVLSIAAILFFSAMFGGLKLVQPNEAKVLTLFGKYYGTISEAGFFFVNPFCKAIAPISNKASEKPQGGFKFKTASDDTNATAGAGARSISLKTQTLNNDKQKVNDVLGNPIVIGAIVIWHVADPTKAVFAVENYIEYLSIQTDSIVRNTARLYPYDIFDDDENDYDGKEKSLRGSSIEIADSMRKELQERVYNAGLEIEEVRITHLAYSEEIAAAMLQRQQAAAVIAARQKIVDGAVGMVKMAIDKLSEDEVVVLDDERKAAMVSNLLVVLCGSKDAQPVVNSGNLY